MKYFKRGWYANPKDVDRIIESYDRYYRIIENQLSDNVKQLMKHRHDTHIVKSYMEEKNYIMELDEEIWGKARFIFENANVQINGKIEDEYWLYDEIYKLGDEIEIHILFDQADAVISCDDAHIEINEKKYFKELYKKRKKEGKKVEKKEEVLKSLLELYNQATHLSKEERQQAINEALSEEIHDREMDPILEDELVETIENKEYVCGKNGLNSYELIIFIFAQLYQSIYTYKYNNIEEVKQFIDEEYSADKKDETYKKIFEYFEKNLKAYIETITNYTNIIKSSDLNYTIEKLLGVYNKKDISMQEKNQLYLESNEKLLKDVDFGKIYMRILDCINEGLIK